MDAPAIRRRRRQRCVVVVLGVLVAVAAGLLVGAAAPPPSGVATGRLVLDTPQSQLVYAAPSKSDTLLSRAVLLSHVVTSDEAVARIAREAGVPVTEFVVSDAIFDEPSEPTTLPTVAVDAALTRPERYSLVVRNDDVLPIISLQARAPDRQAAGRIVDAAKRVMRSLTQPHGNVPTNAVVIEAFQPTQARTVVKGRRYVKAFGVSLAIFGVWCGCGMLLTGMISRARPRAVAASSA
jgi:hypothetical protein